MDSMFVRIFKEELIYWLKRPAIYIYFFVFFAIALLSFAGTAGFFDPPTTSNKTERLLNSPHELNFIMHYFNKFFLFLLPAIIGAGIYRDYKYKVHSILYSYPVKRSHYLWGKFLSALLVVVAISSSAGIAILIGEHLPDLKANKIGVFNIWGYVQAYMVYTIPNLVIFGSIVFAVVLWFRNIYAGFAVVVLLFMIQTITQNAFAGQDILVAMFDPLGQNAAAYHTHLWTLKEQNILMLPVMGMALYNRLFWFALGAVIFLFAYYKFAFTQNAIGSFIRKPGKTILKSSPRNNFSISISKISYDYSFPQQLKNVWSLSNTHFTFIIKNWMFLGFVFLGIVAMLFTLAKFTNTNEMARLPVTPLVLQVPAFFFTGITILITFVYSGMLIHRERSAGINELVDATAAPNYLLLMSKVLAIVKMQAILLLVIILAGISIQLFNGYYHFEIGLYFFHLFVLMFPKLIIWAFAAVLVQTLVTNVYLGMFAMVVAWLGVGALPQIGITTRLLRFNTPPDLIVSGQNGYGSGLPAYFLVEGYWLIFGLVLLIAAYLLWVRGMPQTFMERFIEAKGRFGRPVPAMLGLLLAAFVVTGFTIYQEESKAWLQSEKEQSSSFETFEKKYQRYQGMVQPKITSVKFSLDLYPESNDFSAAGSYKLTNKSSQVIDTLLIKTGFDEITEFEIDGEVNLVSSDPYLQFSVVKLKNGLLPGKSLGFHFNLRNRPNSFFERNSSVLKNGTFLGADIFPRLGYSFGEEKKHPSDSTAMETNYAAQDADLVNFEAIISTSKDQTAIAPGYLQREWTEKGRRYFKFKMNRPIKYQFSINSGQFELLEDKWKDVSLQAYYHNGHQHNIKKMVAGLKAALAYNTKHFSPYQHREAKIIEFPQSEGSHATTMGNSIPISEVRFIANTNDEEGKIDQSFYVSAHELTHQWWGNQVIPADALGAVMLSESITDYITSKIYAQQYGSEKAHKFLLLQRKRYLNGRTSEQETEPPLTLVKQEQSYLSYGKGSLVFNAMSYYLGEDKLNIVLKQFLLDHQFKAAPYPTSLQLVERLKEATPDSLKYVITDLFESVTFYDNKMEQAEVAQLEEGKYQVDLSLTVSKTREDEGESREVGLQDYIEIGFYNEAEELLDIRTYKINKAENDLRLTLDQPPVKIVLDPNLLLMDKNLADNEYYF